MSVTIHPTPNPNAHKYVLAQWRITSPLNVSTAEKASAHPLAERLFALPGIYNLLLAQDFVTVNKLPDTTWEEIDPKVTAILIAYLKEQNL
jgi:hypothetical protein